MGEIVTAGILVIGDEILSGRTKDKNIGFIAEYLTNIGIDLKEVRVVADEEADIVAALAADYVTTARAKGGGPLAVARHALANALVPMVTLLGGELPALVVIAACSVFTAPLGAKAAHSLPVKKLKRVFASILYVLAAYMLWKGLHG